MSIKQQCYIAGFVLVWLLIFIVPGGYYYQRRMNQGGDDSLRVVVSSLSSKVQEHKTSFDKAIADIGEKLNSAIASLDSKIKSLHGSISNRQNKAKKALNQINLQDKKAGGTKGEITQGSLCMDSMERSIDGKVELFECHGQGRNQEWKVTAEGTIINKEKCLSGSEEGELAFVKLTTCSSQDAKQKWERTKNQIKLVGSDRCLDVHVDDRSLVTSACDPSKKTQQWTVA